jgi:hypothetical protein
MLVSKEVFQVIRGLVVVAGCLLWWTGFAHGSDPSAVPEHTSFLLLGSVLVSFALFLLRHHTDD